MLDRMFAAIVAVAVLTCTPATAQDRKASSLSPATLTGGERLIGVAGAGCASGVAPCANVAVTLPALATYLTPTFQARDADLDAIAALTTTMIGRSLLTQADATALRSVIGVTATGADTTYLYRANNLSGLTDVAAARANLGVTATGADPAYAKLTGATFTGSLSAANLLGTNTGDQTITLTGDVSGSGKGSFAVTLATVPVAKGGTGDTGTGWTTYTPSVTPASGAFGAAPTTAMAYKTIGRTVFVSGTVTVSDNGTGSGGSIKVGLPIAGAVGRRQSGFYREDAVAGTSGSGSIASGASVIVLQRYDATYPAQSGSVLVISITYESN